MKFCSPSLIEVTMVVTLLSVLLVDEVSSHPFIYQDRYCELNPSYCINGRQSPPKVRSLASIEDYALVRESWVITANMLPNTAFVWEF